MRHSAARRVAFTGMLFALALAFSWLEAQLTPLLGLPPGVKLGLANIVVMYALFYLSARQALLLVALKAGFALFRGGVAALLSGAGGLLSLAVMLLLMLPKRRLSVLLISIAGALAHNAGQLLVVMLWLGGGSLYYAPVLAISGVAMGCLTAVALRAMAPAMGRLAQPGGSQNATATPAAGADETDSEPNGKP